jgi:CHAT domain/Lecithin:cholesterol acyltransferase
MVTTLPSTITFIVPGSSQAAAAVSRGAAPPSMPEGFSRGRIKQSIRVGAQRGGGSDVAAIATVGTDVVVLHIAGGPVLVLHPENARDLFAAQVGAERHRGGDAVGASVPGVVQVPTSLQWAGLEAAGAQRGATRSMGGDVLLSAVEIVTDLVTDPAADWVASQAVARVDAQVDPGVFRLSADALHKLKGTASPLQQIAVTPDGALALVFVHGTFSETAGSFSKLWEQHPQFVKSLFDRYQQCVYGLEHATLGASPIDNALALARACPNGARLHLVTHSRGGLVGEVLARVCANPTITARDLDFFKGADYAAQRAALTALGAIVAERKLRVDRLVRVACPARGTLLASKRLDAYISVLKWSLELAGIPVAPAIVDFLGEVAQRRADPALIPGLAAQIPDSPLVQWLNAPNDAIAGDLRVIAGDIEGDSVVSWLKTLMADAFFWTDNDLVVQTRSMYGGAPRAAGATFVFDQGGKVSHFNYFFNDRTAEAVTNALLQDSPQGFRVIGPLSWAGESATGFRAAPPAVADAALASDKPAVFVLPGILGSNLKVDGKRIWLSWRLVNGLSRLQYAPDKPDGVEPDGPIGLTYDDFEAFLATTHEVIEFAFDWRRPMEEEAQRLAAAVDAALAARDKSGQPVRFVAHSMGGLIARTMQLERPDVWQRMMEHPGARLLMLGTPNAGSWAPMQVLSGDDTFGNTLVAFGAPFQDHVARQLMAEFPGFIQLQAALDDSTLGLDKSATWQKLADDDLAKVREYNSWHQADIQLNVYRWGVPPQAVIDRAVALRKRLDATPNPGWDSFNSKVVLVVGNAEFTPDGYQISDTGLAYLNAQGGGDGRVTAASARMPGVRTWKIDCEHGKLPARKDAFAAYVELLATGTTALLSPFADTAARGVATGSPTTAHVLSRPSRQRPSSQPAETALNVLAADGERPASAPSSAGAALRINVVNGDLMFVRQPLMLGHYNALRLTGTERVVNDLLGGTMSVSLDAGLYPEEPGAHQIFLNTGARSDNPLQLPRPEAVIVVGLGAEGKLTAPDLVISVRQAVIAWAQRLVEKSDGAPAVFELASTLMASGGINIAVGQAARLIAQGVRDANRRLAQCRWPVVSRLHLIELYLDRAGDVWRALQVQAQAAPSEFIVTDSVQPGAGGLPRLLDSGYRGADYDLISALTLEGKRGESQIVYKLDTKRARSEIRAQATQTRLLRQLSSGASSDRNGDPQIGRTLFNLLVPLEMEPFLGGTTDMQLEVDGGTAGIPWELLDSGAPGGSDPRPWAIRTKLLRKLATADFRRQVADASAEACALVIGEPACDPPYPRLPGARDEAEAVAKCLSASTALGEARVTALISPEDPSQLGADSRTIVGALLGRDWRIIHVAGHGEPPEKIGPPPKKAGDPPQEDGDPRGVVLSDDTFLGPREIRSMRVVPELVFVNCCHLAARNNAQLLTADAIDGVPRDHARFAAGVAEELIKIGVRCVIAAGWAVDDAAAKVFATRFYESLLQGHAFIDAVAAAREDAWNMGGNTWAAYQCYGDPDWQFVADTPDAQRPGSLADDFAGVASSKGLVLALESLYVKSKFQKAAPDSQQTKIRYLEAKFGKQWGDIGEVAEGFARAWDEAGDRVAAIKWYTRALAANDGTASLKIVEQLGNLRARNGWAMADKGAKEFAKTMTPSAAAKGGKSANARAKRKINAADLAKAIKKRDAAFGAGRKEIAAALTTLERVSDLASTIERESLCGSAWKRMAMVEAAATNATAEDKAIVQMKLRYANAEKLARSINDDLLFYPALNRMAAELVVDAAKPGWKGFDPTSVGEVRSNLARKTRDDPDFWSVIGLTELRLYQALARRSLAPELPDILQEYATLYARVSAATSWSSVLDQVRFVLPKYVLRATASEKQAVQTLVRNLEKYASGK